MVRGATYLRCTTCGSGRLDPPPTADPVELYDETYFRGAANGGYLDYDADADMHGRNASVRLSRLRGVLPPGPQHVIDVGCASGYVLDEAVARGWTATGVDASAFARDVARRRSHHVEPTLEDALTVARSVTVVTFFQVLEHLADPAAALAVAAGGLGPGGVVAIETWDLSSRVARIFGSRWQQANPPSVLHLFTRSGIESLAKRVGLEVVDIGATAKQVSVGTVAGIAAGRWSGLNRLTGPVRRHRRLATLAVPYRLGDLVSATMRKQ